MVAGSSRIKRHLLRWACLIGTLALPFTGWAADASLREQAEQASERGDHRTAAALYEQVRQTENADPSTSAAQTIKTLTSLQGVYVRQQNFQQALAVNGQLLALQERTLGARHPDTLETLSDRAYVLGGLRRFQEQLALNEKALALRIDVLGERHPQTLTSMSNLAFTLGELGRGSEQLALNEKVLKLRTEVLGPSHPDTLLSMGNLAFQYGTLGRHDEQIALNQQVVELRTRANGATDPATLRSMSTLAASLSSVGRVTDALAMHREILARRTTRLGARHPDTLASMSAVAAALLSTGAAGEARTLLEQALQIRRELQGEDHPDTLGVESTLAVALQDLGLMAQSIAVHQKVVAARTRLLGPSYPSTLVSASNLAVTLGAAGRKDEALAMHQRVYEQRVAQLGERHPQTQISLFNLAAAVGEAGRLQEQLEMLERLLALRRSVQGEEHPTTIATVASVARALGDLGRVSERLALNEQVVQLSEKVLGPRHPDTLRYINNLASTYSSLGRHNEALALMRKATDLRREVLGERHIETLQSMSNMAVVLGSLGRYQEELALDEKVLALRKEILGDSHPLTLLSMSNLAVLYGNLGRHTDELALHEQVFAQRRRILGEEHPITLLSMSLIGLTLVELDRGDEALTIREKLLALRRKVLGESHPDTLETMKHLAYSYGKKGRYADAAAMSEAFARGAEAVRGQPGLSAENRRSLFEDYAVGYRLFSLYSGAAEQIEQGFRLSELGKGRTLLDGMTAQRAARSGHLPAAEQQALDDINRQIALTDQQLAQAGKTEVIQTLEATRNRQVRQYEALVARLRAAFPRYADLSAPRIVAAADLPGLVPEDSVAVSYVIWGALVTAWVVDSRGKPSFVNLGLASWLEEAVELLRRASSTPAGLRGLLEEEAKRAWRLPGGAYRLLDTAAAPPAGAVAVTDEAEIAAWLSARLLAPLRPHLAARTRWIISPDGPLAQLPFELLSLDGQRVLERVDLHYTQSLSVYALAKARQRDYSRLPRPLDLMAMGNPEYDAAAEPSGTRKAKLRSASITSESQLKENSALWQELPGTDAEIKAIRTLLPNSDAFLRGEASEERLKELNASGRLQQYRYLHFAVHGNLSPRDPALSSLVLSQKNLKPGTDGYVTAAEWPAYDLRSDLTILSACETGLGSNLSGEGVMGLPFALFLAGNVNTVLSLWPVFDEVTPVFMQRFFARLKAGLSASQALTETKREMAADPKTAHPSNWAPFILVGAG